LTGQFSGSRMNNRDRTIQKAGKFYGRELGKQMRASRL
jgi:hypothetical protein